MIWERKLFLGLDNDFNMLYKTRNKGDPLGNFLKGCPLGERSLSALDKNFLNLNNSDR